MKYKYNRGDIIKVNHTFTKETSFWAIVLDVTPNYYVTNNKTIAYKRMDNNKCSFCSDSYIIEVIPPIPRQAPIDESIGEQRHSI